MYFIFLALFFFVTFLILLISGIVKQKRKLIYFSLLALVLSVAGGICFGVIVAKKTYTVIKTANKSMKPRTGMEMYTAIFDKAEINCVNVLNKQDAYIPMIDCCMWLEFTTCPGELERIITVKELMPVGSQSQLIGDSVVTIPDSIPNYGSPDWFKLQNLGSAYKTLRKHRSDDPNHDLILWFSKDSTHAFYCDMAE